MYTVSHVSQLGVLESYNTCCTFDKFNVKYRADRPYDSFLGVQLKVQSLELTQ